MTSIFVSYRREDSASDAGRLTDELVRQYGASNIFQDTGSLLAGDLWSDQIQRAVAGCDVMVVVIGPNWLSVAFPDGTRRLDSENDVVVREVELALASGKRLIPVLVRNSRLPAREELPSRINRLLDHQARELRADSYRRDIIALVSDIGGASMRRRQVGKLALVSIASASLAVGAWRLSVSNQTVESRAGTLRMEVTLDQAADASRGDHMLMALSRPITLPKFPLLSPDSSDPRRPRYALHDFLLPASGEVWRAEISRAVTVGGLVFDGTIGSMTACLQRANSAPTTGLLAVLTCKEGAACGRAVEDPGHFQGCGPEAKTSTSGVSERLSEGRRWSWIKNANAQGAPRAEQWLLPSIETLRLRASSSHPLGYSEIILKSPPLPSLSAARYVSVSATVDGRRAWIDGLPDDASSVPFDAQIGVDLQFGVETLVTPGADQGYNRIGLTLRFTDGKVLIREMPLKLDFVPQRSLPFTLASALESGVRWRVEYHPGKNEGNQVLLASSEDVVQLLEVKVRLDSAKLSVGPNGRSLVAVIRPSLGANPNYGVVVGLRGPDGGVQLNLDDGDSAAVCRELVRDPRVMHGRDAILRPLVPVATVRRLTLCRDL